jgi:outer membrane immunogenic protein
MKHFIVSALAVVLTSGSAMGADIQDYAHDWAGGYVGLQGGYGWGNTKPTYDSGGPTENGDVDFDGFLGGLGAGYQVQNGSVVFGFEADASLANLEGYYVDPSSDVRPCIITGQGCSVDVNWMATARVRAGYAIDTFMPFLTGGLAVGGVEGTFDSPGNACTCDVDDVAWGFVVGGGIEWAVNDRFSTKLEYLYVNLGSPDIEGDNNFVSPAPGVGTDDYDFSIVRVGLNYGF